jgi:membrane protein YqaA with SNARE-associated domain
VAGSGLGQNDPTAKETGMDVQHEEPSTPPRAAVAVAAAWGFAEATLFFVVPDVYLSRLALADLRAALRCCLWALLGALAGGAVMYAMGQRQLAGAERALDAVPAIAPAAIAGVRAEIAGRGTLAVFLGPLSGTPYKIYAVESAPAGLPLGRFLAVSVPARLLRFALVALLFNGLARGPLRRWGAARLGRAHALAWAAFYLVYFALKDW